MGAGVHSGPSLESMSDFRDIIGENFSTHQTPRTKIGEFFFSKNLNLRYWREFTNSLEYFGGKFAEFRKNCELKKVYEIVIYYNNIKLGHTYSGSRGRYNVNC